MRRRLRHILGWKFVFYDVLLPALRALGPAWGDRILGDLGRLALMMQPRRRARLRSALRRAGAALEADWPIEGVWPGLAANTARFLARDYPLDHQPDEAVLARFDVRGYERLRVAMERGRGAILLGCHLGAHIAGVHWLYRRGVPLRLLVQRPRHVSDELNRRFDAGGPHPQAELFLRRDLSPAVAVERILRARAALRDGLAIYMNGDIPWSGPNTCPGRLLGRPQRSSAPTLRAAGSRWRSSRWDGCGRARNPRRSPITSSSSRPGSPTRRPMPWRIWSGHATSPIPTPPGRRGPPGLGEARPCGRCLDESTPATGPPPELASRRRPAVHPGSARLRTRERGINVPVAAPRLRPASSARRPAAVSGGSNGPGCAPASSRPTSRGTTRRAAAAVSRPRPSPRDNAPAADTRGSPAPGRCRRRTRTARRRG